MIHYHEFVAPMVSPIDHKSDGYKACLSAICFEMPSIKELEFVREIPELVKLPYDVCWFEGDGIIACDPIDGDGSGRIGFLAINGGSTISVSMYCYHRDGGIHGGRFTEMQRALFYKKWRKHPEEELWPEDIENLVMGPNLTYLSKFLSLLNCQNIGRAKNEPPEKLQRARQRRGRVPLFSYWTLILRQSNVRGESHGGTHASPRLHLRRGHIRKLPQERHCWVQPCVVGNKERGMVHKDYAMRSSDSGGAKYG